MLDTPQLLLLLTPIALFLEHSSLVCWCNKFTSLHDLGSERERERERESYFIAGSWFQTGSQLSSPWCCCLLWRLHYLKACLRSAAGDRGLYEGARSLLVSSSLLKEQVSLSRDNSFFLGFATEHLLQLQGTLLLLFAAPNGVFCLNPVSPASAKKR